MQGLFSSVIRSLTTRRRASRIMTGLALGFATIPVAHAGWVYGNVTEIQFYSEGTSNDKIVVVGTFNTGCSHPNMFVMGSGDAYFKEIYAAMLTAKLTGTSIKYLHIYCTPDGFSRGNAYSLAE